jgi:hypothetical protein
MLRRLGLLDGQTTLESIGDTLGISRERVRQLQNKALARLQSNARRSGSPAASLSAVITRIGGADSDDALALRLLNATDELFRCDPVWLVMAMSRMAGHSSQRAGELAAVAHEHRDVYRRQMRENARAQYELATLDRFVDKWTRDAVWPDTGSTLGTTRTSSNRRRMPNNYGIGVCGSFRSEKIGRTVYFESRLEESVFTAAEKSSRVLSYQEQPCEVAYTAADGRSRTYYPDLLVTLADGRTVLIEVKPLWQMALTTNRIKCAAGQRFAAERGWGWASVANNGRTYRDLLLRELDNRTRETLTRALATGPISWTAMQLLRLRAPITALDVAAYAAQENIGLSLVPYRLGPDGPENTAVSHD